MALTLRFREQEDDSWTLAVLTGEEAETGIAVLAGRLCETFEVQLQDESGDWNPLGIWSN